MLMIQAGDMIKAGQQRRFEMESTQEEKLNSVDVSFYQTLCQLHGPGEHIRPTLKSGGHCEDGGDDLELPSPRRGHRSAESPTRRK